jgi:hypothetical protein
MATYMARSLADSPARRSGVAKCGDDIGWKSMPG